MKWCFETINVYWHRWEEYLTLKGYSKNKKSTKVRQNGEHTLAYCLLECNGSIKINFKTKECFLQMET